MKIKDLEGKLPARVKVTDGFTTDESIDPGFVVDITQIKAEDKYGDDWCYKIWFNIPPELIPICTKVSKSDWRDASGNYVWNYFEANKRLDKNGTYQDTAYVMDCDDWFEFYEEPKVEYVPIVTIQDNDDHWYIIPKELTSFFVQLAYYDQEDKKEEFNAMFSKYLAGGSLNNYQLYISQNELRRLTNEL